MIATTIAVLFSVIALATALTLVDFWLRASSAYVSLRRQSALVRAGFVPQVDAQFVRLRPAASRMTPGATRPFAKRVPSRSPASARSLGAA